MSRRLVAVLFMDLVGWTELGERLDPEPLQQFLERYYDVSVAAVEQHGGIVEKFIGDAIMAVFGAQRSEEDDGLRALRAAFQARSAVSGLEVAGADHRGPAVHCGIAAGEAFVTRSAHAGVRIVGDVVNLAARLQSAAGRGEILVNEVMTRLVRSHAVAVPTPPMTLKGKRKPVPAWRVVELATASSGAGIGVPLVDRQDERAYLRDASERVTRTRQAHAVKVLGPPGIGKSRLVREAIDHFEAEEPRPLIAWGAWPSYSSAGSYAPLGRMLDVLMRDDRLARRAAAIRGGQVLDVLTHIRSPSTMDNEGSHPGVEEVSWAVRELLRAAGRPLVLVWEDLQWASPVLVEIVAELAAGLRDHPALLIWVARPELARGAPAWDVLDVRPLRRPDTSGLVGLLASRLESREVSAQDADVLDRIVDDCGGNPLYAELIVETLALGYPLGVPPTVTALVGALVDRLPPDCVSVLELASVIGEYFTLEQLAGMDAEPAPAVIDALLGRQLIAPGAGPAQYRFAQQMVHEVVYGRLDKGQRLGWHRRLAEQEASPAFHLESAVRLLRDLRPGDPELPELAARAAGALLAEGTYALRRRNVSAAVDLLKRARDVQPADGAQQAAVTVRLSDALLLAGDLDGARVAVAREVEGAADPRVEIASRVHRALLAVRSGQVDEVAIDALTADLRRDEADHLSWCRFHQLRALLHMADGRFGAAERSARLALRRAEDMCDEYEQDRLLVALCEVGQWSPTPIPEKLAFCGELAARFAGDRCLLVPVLVAQARFLALLGDVDEARAALAEARQTVTDLRLTMAEVLVDQGTGMVASLAGAQHEAERHFRSAARSLDLAGHRPAALALRALAVRERVRSRPDDEAADEVRDLSRRTGEMDLRGRVVSEAVAVRVAVEASTERTTAVLELLARTDDPCLRGDVLIDLAAGHRRRGDHARARATAREALDNFAAVGALSPMRRLREWV